MTLARSRGDRDAALKLTSSSRLAAGTRKGELSELSVETSTTPYLAHGHRAALLPGAQSTQLSLPALQWDGRSGGLLGSRAGAAGLQAERTSCCGWCLSEWSAG